MKNINKKLISILVLLLTFLNGALTLAENVNINDDNAFITRTEFDNMYQNFHAQIDNLKSNIDREIDTAIAAYIGGISLKLDFEGDNIYKELESKQPILWSSKDDYSVNGTIGHKYNWNYYLLMEFFQSGTAGAAGLDTHLSTTGAFKIFYNGNDPTKASFQLIDYDPQLNWVFVKCNSESSSTPGSPVVAFPNNSAVPGSSMTAYLRAPTANDYELKFGGRMQSNSNLEAGAHQYYNYITLFAPKKENDTTTALVLAPKSVASEYVYDENLASSEVPKSSGYGYYEFNPAGNWTKFDGTTVTNLKDDIYKMYGWYWNSELPWCKGNKIYNEIKFLPLEHDNIAPDSKKGIWITKNTAKKKAKLKFKVTADYNGTFYMYESNTLSKEILSVSDSSIKTFNLTANVPKTIEVIDVQPDNYIIGGFLPTNDTVFAKLTFDSINFTKDDE